MITSLNKEIKKYVSAESDRLSEAINDILHGVFCKKRRLIMYSPKLIIFLSVIANAQVISTASEVKDSQNHLLQQPRALAALPTIRSDFDLKGKALCSLQPHDGPRKACYDYYYKGVLLGFTGSEYWCDANHKPLNLRENLVAIAMRDKAGLADHSSRLGWLSYLPLSLVRDKKSGDTIELFFNTGLERTQEGSPCRLVLTCTQLHQKKLSDLMAQPVDVIKVEDERRS